MDGGANTAVDPFEQVESGNGGMGSWGHVWSMHWLWGV